MATSPIDPASPPPIKSPEPTLNSTMMPAPQPSQLISASKIQRIDVWRTEVEKTDLVCVCSLSTAPSCLAGPSRPLMLATRSTQIYSPPGSMPLSSAISAHSHAQQSPASSIYSSSEAYASTQATSPLSSNSLGLMLDGKLGLCPQCGVRKADRSSQDSEREPGIVPTNTEANGADRNAHETSRKKQLWLGVKRLARKCTGKDPSPLQQQPAVAPAITAAGDAKPQDLERDTLGRVVSRSLSRLSVHGFTTPTPAGNLQAPTRNPGHDRQHEPPTPATAAGVALEPPKHPNVRKRASQAFKRISVHLGAPLQTSPPPEYATSPSPLSPQSPQPCQKSTTPNRPSAEGARSLGGGGGGGGGGTQMYSSLRHAAPDDERLMEILGAAKFMNATVAAQPPAANAAAEDAMVDLDALEREDEDEENGRPGVARLRERAERLERGRRLLARNGGPQPSKRPISFAGVAAISMGARF